ncbi:MAG: glycosyltransferase family 39 protein [bacterium]|nr:glycosyltransferase family 39 protein [bacterium]
MLNQFTASLWGDEGFSAILSMKSFPDLIRTVARDTSPPLWNINEWVVFNIFGASEVAIRSLAFFYYLIAAFFAYKIAGHFWNRKTALIATILTFLNPFFFIYAFEGRMYSILAAGVTASMYFFIKKQWLPYVISTLWAMYSHHFAIFALFVQGLWFLFELFGGDKKTAKSMFKAFIAIGVGYIPWLIPLYNQTRMVGGGFWLGTPTTTDLRNLFFDYLGEGIKHPYARLARILVIVALALRVWTKDIKKSLLLFLWFVLPVFTTWLVSQKFTSIFFNRYLLYTIPAAMILLATNRRKLGNFLIFVIIALFAIIDWHYFTHPTKIPFRDLAFYVKQTQTKEDLLINEDAGNHKLWESKYYGIPAPIYNPSNEPLPFFVGTALMEKSDIISEIPRDTERLGVITYKKVPELKFRGFRAIEEKSFGNLNFIWMEKIK